MDRPEERALAGEKIEDNDSKIIYTFDTVFIVVAANFGAGLLCNTGDRQRCHREGNQISVQTIV